MTKKNSFGPNLINSYGGNFIMKQKTKRLATYSHDIHVLELLDAYCKKTLITKSKLVNHLIKQYLKSINEWKPYLPKGGKIER